MPAPRSRPPWAPPGNRGIDPPSPGPPRLPRPSPGPGAVAPAGLPRSRPSRAGATGSGRPRRVPGTTWAQAGPRRRSRMARAAASSRRRPGMPKAPRELPANSATGSGTGGLDDQPRRRRGLRRDRGARAFAHGGFQGGSVPDHDDGRRRSAVLHSTSPPATSTTTAVTATAPLRRRAAAGAGAGIRTSGMANTAGGGSSGGGRGAATGAILSTAAVAGHAVSSDDTTVSRQASSSSRPGCACAGTGTPAPGCAPGEAPGSAPAAGNPAALIGRARPCDWPGGVRRAAAVRHRSGLGTRTALAVAANSADAARSAPARARSAIGGLRRPPQPGPCCFRRRPGGLLRSSHPVAMPDRLQSHSRFSPLQWRPDPSSGSYPREPARPAAIPAPAASPGLRSWQAGADPTILARPDAAGRRQRGKIRRRAPCAPKRFGLAAPKSAAPEKEEPPV